MLDHVTVEIKIFRMLILGIETIDGPVALEGFNITLMAGTALLEAFVGLRILDVLDGCEI